MRSTLFYIVHFSFDTYILRQCPCKRCVVYVTVCECACVLVDRPEKPLRMSVTSHSLAPERCCTLAQLRGMLLKNCFYNPWRQFLHTICFSNFLWTFGFIFSQISPAISIRCPRYISQRHSALSCRTACGLARARVLCACTRSSLLTISSSHLFSFIAPQQPINPMIITRAPAAIMMFAAAWNPPLPMSEE